MMNPVTIENEALKVQVYPQYGGKVASVVDKADAFDLMFSYPRSKPTAPDYDINYGDGWYAGWDECFPGIGAGPYPKFPYEGAKVPDHGELWGIPTEYQHSQEGVLTRWRGIRFGYEFSRHLLLVGSTLEASYELKNCTPFDFHFVWALHSLMRMDLPVQFDAGDSAKWRWSHKADGTQQNTVFDWPTVSTNDNLSRPSDLPADRGWKLFSASPIEKPFDIVYPTRKRGVQISYESDSNITAYWGVWINSGGWAGHRHFAVEPTTGLHDHLEASMNDGSAAKIGPLSSVSWTVRWTMR